LAEADREQPVDGVRLAVHRFGVCRPSPAVDPEPYPYIHQPPPMQQTSTLVSR